DAVAIVPDSPAAAPYRAAVGVIAATGPRMRERTTAGTALALDRPPDGAAASAVPGSPWIVVATLHPGDADPVATFRSRSLWFAPALAALAALMAWGIVISVQRPLLTLTRAAESIAAGDLSAPI